MTCHTLTLKPTASALFTPSRGITVLLKSLRPANGTPRVEASMTRWRCNTAGLADRQTMPALRPSLSSSLLTELTPSTNWERFSFSWSAWGLGCWLSGVLWLLSVTTSSKFLLTSSKHCFLLGGSTQELVPVSGWISAMSGGFSEVVFFVDFFFGGCRSANDLAVYGKKVSNVQQISNIYMTVHLTFLVHLWVVQHFHWRVQACCRETHNTLVWCSLYAASLSCSCTACSYSVHVATSTTQNL